MNNLRIAFLGTPEFAATCLDLLIKNGHNIVVVITAVDRKKGRGQKVLPSEVKSTAEKYNIPILQPPNLKDESFIAELKEFNIDLGVVVAFRMLPERVWNLPQLGTINLHASLLPNYRGAAPINWALINGESKTGITTFFLKHEIDTGDILMQKEVVISEDMNAGELHDLLMTKGSELLSETINKIASNSIQSIPQDEVLKSNSQLRHAPKIFKPDCQINWNEPSLVVHNKIRGLSPYPGAWSIFLNNKSEHIIFKVYKAIKTDLPIEDFPGKMRVEESKKLFISCSDTYIEVLVIQVEGKRKMNVQEFLQGFNIEEVKILPHE